MTSSQVACMTEQSRAQRHYTAEMLTDRLEEIRAILRDPNSKVGALLPDEQVKIADMLYQTIEAIKTCSEDV